jgi:hypothetical protein
MKKILISLSLILLLISAVWAGPKVSQQNSYDPAAVAITGGNISVTNATATNITVSGVVNATNATWQGFNVGTGTVGNLTSTNANITGGNLAGITSGSFTDLTVSNVANVTNFAGAGISSSTSSNATNVVATSNAVKIAYDLANGKQDASANLTVLAGNNGANLTDIPVASVVGAANAIYRGTGTALTASSLTDDGSGNVSASGNMTINGTAYIGDTANTKSTQGLTINQGANDDEIVSLKSSDVAHGTTSTTEADTYGFLKKNNADVGGLSIQGFTDATGTALYLRGAIGASDPNDITPAVEFEGMKWDGSTGGAALSATETVFSFKNLSTQYISILGDGKTNFWKTANDGTNYEGLQIDPATAGNMQIKYITGGTGSDNGDITITPAGTGAVKTGTAELIDTHYDTIFIPASAMTSTATNGAVISTAEYATNDINMDYLLFDGTTEEYAEFQFPMPEGWDRGTVKAKVFWSSATGSTANDTVEWEIAGGALSNDDAIDAALGTAQVISDVLLADNGTDLQVSGATPAITIGGTPALGDLIHFKISRNVGGTDDMTEDARLFGVWIQYKVNTSVATW